MADRKRRANEAVRQVLGQAVGALDDPRIGFVTITDVRVTGDRKRAEVFFTVLGDDDARERTLAGLRAARGALQLVVGRELKMRDTPHLLFTYDNAADEALRIGKMLADESSNTPVATSKTAVNDSYAEVAATLRSAHKVLVASHENPDGDALGSARAMQVICERLELDTLVYIPKAAVPAEYALIAPTNLLAAAPADIGERLLVCVDCGNAGRLAEPDLCGAAADVINIDHHADNSRFGRLNIVEGDRSCAAEMVLVLARELGLAIDRELGTPLYVGLVTDTGRFQYPNTTPEALTMAADLVAAGVDQYEIFRNVYEHTPLERVKLLGRALEAAIVVGDGAIVATQLTRADFSDCAAGADDSEGIVDHLRSIEGIQLALFVRELPAGSEFRYKGSLRTSRADIDVSVLARVYGGGGHRAAAGFSTNDDFDDIVAAVVAHLVGASQPA